MLLHLSLRHPCQLGREGAAMVRLLSHWLRGMQA